MYNDILGLNDYVLKVKCKAGGTRGGGVGAYSLFKSLTQIVILLKAMYTNRL